MKAQVKAEKTFQEHIKELRLRLTWAVLTFIAGGFVGYIYRWPVINFLKAPVHSTLYYTTPAGGFNLVMEVSAVCGLMIAIPMLTYQLVRFVTPGWSDKIGRHQVLVVTVLSAILAVLGASFGYFVMLPLSLHFFREFSISGVKPLISANYYLDFVIKCILTFIFIFQLPLFILFVNRIKPLSPRKLLKWEKYVIIGSLLLAVVLPFTYDPLSQFILAVPIIGLYNISLFLVWRTNRRKNRKLQKSLRAKPVVMQPPAKITQAPKPVVAAPVRGRPIQRRPVDVTISRSKNGNYMDLRKAIPRPASRSQS